MFLHHNDVDTYGHYNRSVYELLGNKTHDRLRTKMLNMIRWDKLPEKLRAIMKQQYKLDIALISNVFPIHCDDDPINTRTRKQLYDLRRNIILNLAEPAILKILVMIPFHRLWEPRMPSAPGGVFCETMFRSRDQKRFWHSSRTHWRSSIRSTGTCHISSGWVGKGWWCRCWPQHFRPHWGRLPKTES